MLVVVNMASPVVLEGEWLRPLGVVTKAHRGISHSSQQKAVADASFVHSAAGSHSMNHVSMAVCICTKTGHSLMRMGFRTQGSLGLIESDKSKADASKYDVVRMYLHPE